MNVPENGFPRPRPHPRFFALDGLDGSGKSTQMALLIEWLAESGQEVVSFRDPGSTELGESVRKLLLEGDEPRGLKAESLLYLAARSQLVEERINPALAAGKFVVCDRFLFANLVYQGYAVASDDEVERLFQVAMWSVGGLLPALTIVLDLDPEVAAQRIGRELDRMEGRGADFRRAVRAGYHRAATRWPDWLKVIDAGRSRDEVQTTIRDLAAQASRMA